MTSTYLENRGDTIPTKILKTKFKLNKESTTAINPNTINTVGKNRFPLKELISIFKGNFIISPTTKDITSERI